MRRTRLLIGLIGAFSGCGEAAMPAGDASRFSASVLGDAGRAIDGATSDAAGTGGSDGGAVSRDAASRDAATVGDADVDANASADAGVSQAQDAACDATCGRPTDPSVIGKTLLDFSAAQVDAEAIENAGHSGVVHYVSPPREAWMLAKPVTQPYADSLASRALFNVSNYQFGKGATSDWRGGFDNGVACAQEAVLLHQAAGGPPDAVIYASIDDNPTLTEFNTLIGPYLQGWQSVIGKDRLGVYANYRTIDWCLEDGYGTYFWQHYWNGTGDRTVHPNANITQERIDKDTVDGTGVDINVIRKADFGQWHW